MPDHGMDIQKQDLTKDIGRGVGEHRHPCNGGIGGEEGKAGAPPPPLGQASAHKGDIDGGGAKLERKAIPVIRPARRGIIAVGDLLADLPKEQSHTKGGQRASELPLPARQAAAVKDEEQGQRQYDRQGTQMKCAEAGGAHGKAGRMIQKCFQHGGLLSLK